MSFPTSDFPSMRDWRPASNPRPDTSFTPLLGFLLSTIADLNAETQKQSSRDARVWSRMKDLLNPAIAPGEDAREVLGDDFDDWAQTVLIDRLAFMGIPMQVEHLVKVVRRDIESHPNVSVFYIEYSAPVSEDAADEVCEKVAEFHKNSPAEMDEFSALMIANRQHKETGEHTFDLVAELAIGGSAEMRRAVTRQNASINQTAYEVAQLLAAVE